MPLLKPAVMFVAFFALSACDPPSERLPQGWVESDLIFVSPDEQGRVEALNVREGDRVKKGEVLFTLDDNLQESDLLVKRTMVANAQQALDRARELLSMASGTRKAYEDAEAALRQAKANLDWSQTRLNRRNGVSPAEGIVQQVYFRPGETAPPGRPVLSLLAPGNLKIRFFVPETMMGRIHYGETILISCDTCAKGLTAKITFIASSAEYTPPVIYSQEERSKLVYLIQAQPTEPAAFRVAQPVTITLSKGDGQ